MDKRYGPLGKRYLRVLTPQTTDGLSPKYDENDKVVLKETFLPLSAEKHLERQNEALPKSLQHRYTVVDEDSLPLIPEEKKIKSEDIPQTSVNTQPLNLDPAAHDAEEFTMIGEDGETPAKNKKKSK